MRRRLGLAWVLPLLACAAVPRSSAPPGPSVAATVRVPTEPAAAPPLTLRFEAPEQGVVVQRRRGPQALPPLVLLGPAAVADAFALQAWTSTPHAVAPLSSLLADAAVDGGVEVAVEASAACKSPWLVDLAAATPTLQPRLRVTTAAAASDVRVGCGRVQQITYDTEHGFERVIVYGEVPFDARIVAGDLAIMRTRVEQIFGARVRRPWRTEVVVVPGGPRPLPPRAVPTPSGMRVLLDGEVGWRADARLLSAATMSRIWLAQHVQPLLGAVEATPLHAAALHGLSHGIAREALFGLGLITPEEYAEDLDRAEQTVAEADDAPTPAPDDARRVAAWAAELSVQAASVSWAMRARAHEPNLALALTGTRERLEAPPSDLAALWRALAEPWLGATAQTSPVPARARGRLGTCIAPRRSAREVAALGLSLPWRAGGAATIAAVASDGAAARAGVAPGDVLVTIDGLLDTVSFVVERDGALLELSATAPRHAVRSTRWQRRASVPDDRCYPAF
ncbi:MAG: hypothetical protein K1X88_00810 [Nannocystaceae bacterium]|nr:hypothetical protein [Nannocystaceae bacterium]